MTGLQVPESSVSVTGSGRLRPHLTPVTWAAEPRNCQRPRFPDSDAKGGTGRAWFPFPAGEGAGSTPTAELGLTKRSIPLPPQLWNPRPAHDVL